MKAVAVYPAEKRYQVIDNHPEPSIDSPGQAKVRILDVGICGTDKEIVAFEYGEPPQGSDYLVLGHESLGEVLECGADVTHLHPGDLVVTMGAAAVSASFLYGLQGGAPGLLLHRRFHRARHQGTSRLYDGVHRR